MPSPVAIALDIGSAVLHIVRRHHQVDGLGLTGFGGSVTETGTIPVVGSPCMGNPGHGASGPASSTLAAGEGCLYVNYGTTRVLRQ